MDKPHVLLIGILAIAIGFFALRFSADDTGEFDSVSGYDLDGTEMAMRDRASGGSFDGEEWSGGRQSSRAGNRSMRRSARAEGGRGSRFGTARGAGKQGGRADTVTAGSRGSRRGRVIGGGSRSGRGRTSGGSVSTAPGISSKKRTGSAGAPSRSNSDRVELLSNKEATIDPFYDGTELDDDPTDDVLLEVTTQDDADRKANVIDGVENSDDGEWLEVGEEAELTFPNLGNANIESGSVALDIIPNWNGSDPTNNSLLQMREPHEWSNAMQLVKNGEFLRFIVRDDGGHEADISFKIGDWQQGEPHKVLATWDEGVTTLWVDGKRVGSNTFPGKFNPKSTTPLHVFSDYQGGSYAGADSRGKVKVFDGAKHPDET